MAISTATLVAARPEGATTLDWEVVAGSDAPVHLQPAVHSLEVETSDDRRFSGMALVVRSDGRAHVLRGAGVLHGFDEAELR